EYRSRLLRRHGEIGIENHQDVAARGLEAGKHGIALARPWLAHRERQTVKWRRQSWRMSGSGARKRLTSRLARTAAPERARAFPATIGIVNMLPIRIQRPTQRSEAE